jgi:hypothetical protein
MNAIQRFLDSWDDHKHPFVWVKTAEEVIHSLGSSPRTTNNYGRPLATQGLPADVGVEIAGESILAWQGCCGAM